MGTALLCEVASVEQLSPLLDMIHDRWIESDEIRYVAEENLLILPVDIPTISYSVETGWLFKRWRYDIDRAFLEIAVDASPIIRDGAMIGGSHINTVLYDGEKLRITFCETFSLEALASRLSIRLFSGDRKVGVEMYRTFRWTTRPPI